MALYCEIEDLITESDVEQKFVFPFLSNPAPMGLGLSSSEIFTKQVLRQRVIGKGHKQKLYYPDYLIVIRGIPTLVVEAKRPNEDMGNGYSEARLYAQEVNASFPHNVNVCQYVITCNGREMWIGYSDQADPLIQMDYDDFTVENLRFGQLISLISRCELEKLADKPYFDIRGKARFDTPVALLGGKRVQNEELVENSFGRTLVFENRSIFDPENEHDRTIIVTNAYITSAKREQHAEPMYKEIRKFSMPSQNNSTALATEHPSELVNKLSEKVINCKNASSLILLIGNVGSGKTTFTRYFKQVFLAQKHPDLYASCEWVFINMNFAPLEKTEIYTWLKEKILEGIINEHQNMDFNSYDMISKVFRQKINGFEKGLGSLLRENQIEFKKELYLLLSNARTDSSIYLESMLLFIKENFMHIPIIVLDNCDKRTKEEQLLMFEVAQWLRENYKCIVILPMRDNTYDSYKSEPPLDTVVKDLVFRIDPPDLLKVLQARLDYISRIADQEGTIYILQNGMQVSVKRSEFAEYFRLIMVAIRKDRWISDIFYRLSDRNTRNGIQIFEDLCKSGHMNSSDIFAMRVLGESAEIPTYKFMNVLLRKNRRYYNGDASNFINLFASDYYDDFPDPFVRSNILHWLKVKEKTNGPAFYNGMFSVSLLLMDLQLYGHKNSVIRRELIYMIKRGLVFCDCLHDCVGDQDQVKISLPGSLHLNMLSNVAYLAACAEDTLFKNSEIMMRISRRLWTYEHNARLVIGLNAYDLILYLSNYLKEYTLECQKLINADTLVPAFDLAICHNAVMQWVDSDPNIEEIFRSVEKYKQGTIVCAIIVRKSGGGLVCNIDNEGVKGFLATTEPRYNLPLKIYEDVSLGDSISCEILEFDCEHKSFQLSYLNIITKN